MLACEAVDAGSYREYRSPKELAVRIADRTDSRTAALLTWGMTHLALKLQRLNVVTDTGGLQKPSL